MSSDPDGTTEVEQRHPKSPAPAAASEPARDSATSELSSRVDRLRAWFSANPLRVETLLAVVAVGLGILAVPIVAFGSLVALGGDARILEAGMLVVVAGLLSLVGLAVALLVHAHIELRDEELYEDDPDALSVVYGATRAAESLVAGLFLLGLLATVGSLVVTNSVSDLLEVATGIAGLLLPILVVCHAVGAVVRSVIDPS